MAGMPTGARPGPFRFIFALAAEIADPPRP